MFPRAMCAKEASRPLRRKDLAEDAYRRCCGAWSRPGSFRGHRGARAPYTYRLHLPPVRR